MVIDISKKIEVPLLAPVGQKILGCVEWKRDRRDPAKVLHLIQGLEIGGLEMMVVNFIEKLDRSRFVPEVVCFDTLGELSERLEAQGVPVHFVKRHPGIDYYYIFRLASFLRHNQVDILHLHNPTAFFYGTLAAKLVGLSPIIYTEHGRDFSSSKKIKMANRWLGKLVDKVVAVADFSRHYLIDHEGISESKVLTIHNGIDGERYAAKYDVASVRASLGLTEEQAVIGIVARLDPIKNHALLIKSMKKVLSEQRQAILLIIGDGPLRVELKQLCNELCFNENIRFLGSRSDVPELLSALDVFVLCSISEGLSLTLAEASAAGKPIVVTNVGGNSEVVQDGVSGHVVPSNCVDSLANAILDILNKPELSQQMGQAGRERFEQQFTLHGMVKSYQDLYEQCLRT